MHCKVFTLLFPSAFFILPLLLLVPLSASVHMAPAVTPHVDGFRGIWFELGQKSKCGDKYSGGLGAYTGNHVPMARYVKEVGRTHFTWGGTPPAICACSRSISRTSTTAPGRQAARCWSWTNRRYRFHHNTLIGVLPSTDSSYTKFPLTNRDPDFWTAARNELAYVYQNNLHVPVTVAPEAVFENPGDGDYRPRNAHGAVDPSPRERVRPWHPTAWHQRCIHWSHP